MPAIPSWAIHHFAEVASTMDEARTLAAGGAPHGTTVLAQLQTGGRGRGGRVWNSPVGNLHATILLRPDPDPRRAPELGFVVALAVAQGVDGLAGPGTALKWPNDVLRDGAKLAGILLERLDDGAVIAGIGMNVALKPAGMPYPVTSLRALGCPAEPEAALSLVLDQLGSVWAAWQSGGFAPILAQWRARGPVLGAPMRVRLGSGLVEGRFAGLGADGTLLLDTAAGRRALVAGDVLF